MNSRVDREILRLLSEDARISNADIAAALSISEKEVTERIAELEGCGVIKGYRCVIDNEKLDTDGSVSAIIELKVTPQAEYGFDDVAKAIARYPNVESVSLMSGACDLTVVVNAKSFREVASFVAEELAVMDAVKATATQFIMRRYKEFGVELFSDKDDERSAISL